MSGYVLNDNDVEALAKVWLDLSEIYVHFPVSLGMLDRAMETIQSFPGVTEKIEELKQEN